MKKIFLWCFILINGFEQIYAQNTRENQLFVGYIAAGMNATQIAGDSLAGYRKVGANIGVGAYIMYKPTFSNSIELTYSMKGSQKTFNDQNPLDFGKYSFDYVEIPILFNYHESDIAIFHGGFTVGRLIRYQLFEVASLVLPTSEPKKWDFAATVGATFLIKERFGLNFKVNFSMNSLWDLAVSSSRARRGGWYHNALNFRFVYLFKPKPE
jgi:hypothetical protein